MFRAVTFLWFGLPSALESLVFTAVHSGFKTQCASLKPGITAIKLGARFSF